MAVTHVLPRQPCPATALTFTRLNHSCICCLAPLSFLLCRGHPPLHAAATEPFEPGRGPGCSRLSFSKASQVFQETHRPPSPAWGPHGQLSHSLQDEVSHPGQLSQGHAHGFPSPLHPCGASSTLPAAPASLAPALPPHPVLSAAVISQQSACWPQLPSSSSSSTGGRKERGIVPFCTRIS